MTPWRPSDPVTDAAALWLFAVGLALLPAAIVLGAVAAWLPVERR